MLWSLSSLLSEHLIAPLCVALRCTLQQSTNERSGATEAWTQRTSKAHRSGIVRRSAVSSADTFVRDGAAENRRAESARCIRRTEQISIENNGLPSIGQTLP